MSDWPHIRPFQIRILCTAAQKNAHSCRSAQGHERGELRMGLHPHHAESRDPPYYTNHGSSGQSKIAKRGRGALRLAMESQLVGRTNLSNRERRANKQNKTKQNSCAPCTNAPQEKGMMTAALVQRHEGRCSGASIARRR